MPENRISIEISAEDLQKIKDNLNTLKETLNPYLISVGVNERKNLPKMQDKTKPFVEKVLGYVQSDSQFTPPYMDVAEMEKDFKVRNELRDIQVEIEQIEQSLDDSILVAGSEAYVASLAYYNSVKQATKMNIPEAKTIYEDLKKRFEQ